MLNSVKNRNHVHAIFEIDLTIIEEKLKLLYKKNIFISKPLYLLYCYGQLMAKYPILRTINYKKIKWVEFKDVDILYSIEAKLPNKQRLATGLVIKQIDKKTILEVKAEISQFKKNHLADIYSQKNNFISNCYKWFLRNFASFYFANPWRFKKSFGISLLTTLPNNYYKTAFSILGYSPHPHYIAVGGFFKKYEPIAGVWVERVKANITMSIDHYIIDGAEAIEYCYDYINQVENGTILNQYLDS